IGVKKKLASYLPTPVVTFDGERYSLNYDLPHSIGRIRGFLCNFPVLIRAFVYIRMLGAEGLKRASELAVLNSNYLAVQVSKVRGFQLAFPRDSLRKHEAVFSCVQLKKDVNVTAGHVAKKLLDCGMHSPTVYFPPVVEEALMVEPTESETLEEMDRFVECLCEISNEAYGVPGAAVKAPVRTASAAVDEVKASHPRTLALSWRMLQRRQREAADAQQGKLER
ncbi:MAG: aminomethyl-transferring glycine dehydrogenase subunit GcvPB, partial [Candidatus Bathyarchaeia archaeon]